MNRYNLVNLNFKDSNYNLIAINGENLGEVRFNEDPALLNSDGVWEKIKACINGHIVNGYLDVSKLKPITDISLKDRSLALTDESEILKNSRSINEICIQALSIKEENKSFLRSLMRLNIDYNEYQEAIFESENNDEDFENLLKIFNKTFPNNSYEKIKSSFIGDTETSYFLDKFSVINILSKFINGKFRTIEIENTTNYLFSKIELISNKHANSFIEYALQKAFYLHNNLSRGAQGQLLNRFPLLKIKDLLEANINIKYKSIIYAAKIALLINNEELFNFFAEKAAKKTGFGITSKDLVDLASATTNTEIFESLLSKIPDLDLIDCIETAAQSNFHMVTDFLLSKTEIISGEDLNRIVESISDPTDKSVFDFFYNAKDSITYSTNIDKSLVSKSILLNLKKFLLNGADISDIHLIQAFKLAVKFGNQSLVEFYLSKISTIDLSGFLETGLPNHQMLKDFILAISNKDVEYKIIEFILEHIATFLSKGAFMLSEDIGKALELAVKINNKSVIKFLLSEHRHIPEANLGETIKLAVKLDNISVDERISILNLLLSENRHIPEADLGEAVKIAVKLDNRSVDERISILNLLLSEDRHISKTDLGEAVKIAVNFNSALTSINGRRLILELLLSNGRIITEDDLYYAIYDAFNYADLLTFELLLSGGRSLPDKDLFMFIHKSLNIFKMEFINFFILKSELSYTEMFIKFTEEINNSAIDSIYNDRCIYNFIINKIKSFVSIGIIISDKCLDKMIELATSNYDLRTIEFFSRR